MWSNKQETLRQKAQPESTRTRTIRQAHTLGMLLADALLGDSTQLQLLSLAQLDNQYALMGSLRAVLHRLVQVTVDWNDVWVRALQAK